MASNRSLRSPRSRPWLAALPCAAALALWPAAVPARAWTPKTHQTIAWEAARLAPPDLARQLMKRRAAYLAGVIEPFDDSDASRHRKDPDGGGSLDAALEDAVAQAVAAIRAHHSFDDIAFRMGVAAHFMADANNPLASSQADPEAGRYFVDFLRYAETAEPRFPLVFTQHLGDPLSFGPNSLRRYWIYLQVGVSLCCKAPESELGVALDDGTV